MGKRYRLLSYPLNRKTPLYGDTKPLEVHLDREISKGNSCNTAMVTLSNHLGTHIDTPRHFSDCGRAIAEYDIEELIFESPRLIGCPREMNELVRPQDLKDYEENLKECDLLLIRTGFFKFRGNKEYCISNPGVSPETADWLRSNYPHIRGVGIDSLSISAFQYRDLGRKAHQIFFQRNGYSGEPLIIVEDVNLGGDFGGLKRVFVIPLYVEEVDSMPATVIGEFEI
jgi:kynurenine formamidase